MPLRKKHSRAISWALLKMFCRLPGGAPALLHCDNAREFRHLAARGPQRKIAPADDIEPGGTSEDESDSDGDIPLPNASLAEESASDEDASSSASSGAGEKREKLNKKVHLFPVKRVCEIWPKTRLVHGRARHSESQGGIERANQTVEGVIGKWQEDHNTRQWIGPCLSHLQLVMNNHQSDTTNFSPQQYVTGNIAPGAIKMAYIGDQMLAEFMAEVAEENELDVDRTAAQDSGEG